jgi:uncharacterized glyoxalase superfamily protein PhnB
MDNKSQNAERQTITPYLRLRRAAEAIEFYKKAFGAEELMRLAEPGTGRMGHAELRIGNSVFMLSDEYPEMNIVGPESIGGTSASILLTVADVDNVTSKAEAAGAAVIMAPRDQFYGERSAKIRDPFGHEWIIATPIEDVSVEEMNRRYEELMKAKA